MVGLIPRPQNPGGLRLLVAGIILTLVLSPLLASPVVAAPSKFAPYVDGELIVGYKAGVGQVEQTANEARHGDQKSKQFKNINARLVKIGGGRSVQQAILEYKADSAVAYAEPNYIVKAVVTPNDSSFSQLWALATPAR